MTGEQLVFLSRVLASIAMMTDEQLAEVRQFVVREERKRADETKEGGKK
jgi:hypothetical protein